MSGQVHDTNTAYLAAASNWVRLLLERKIAQQEKTAPTHDDRSGCNLLTRRSAPLPVTAALARSFDEAALKSAGEVVENLSTASPPPALITLAAQLGLTTFERNILLLCATLEFDTRVPSLCARAQDDVGRAYPTFALALAIFDEVHWDSLAPERPLRYWRLIEIHQGVNQTLTGAMLRADERIVNAIKGLTHLDERLSTLISPVEDFGESLPPSHAEIAARIVHDVRALLDRDGFAVVQLIGSDPPTKLEIASAVAQTFGLILYRLRAEHLSASAAEIDLIARLWARETELIPLCLLVEAQETASNESQAGLVRRLIQRARSVVFLDVRELWSDDTGKGLLYDISRPTPAEQRSAWSVALDDADADAPAALAGQFDLNMPSVRRIAQIALADTRSETPLLDRLWDACLRSSRPRLEMLAQHIDARADWTQLVLPDEETRLLRQIAAQIGQRSRVYDEWGFRKMMNRGLGISVLFAGPSGTGKTMAAEVLARDLGLILYKIDLSAVVSKYIGETEKNLRQLFDAAEYGGVILFFDEADALFGKRSEVKDSHDRYANIEVNYLLQRIESYRGLAILATNMKSALDTAFLRRLRFIVDFPFPTATYRKHIWKRAFPAGVPTASLDFDRLARLNLSGGHIHNIAINAAFLAANDDPPVVTMAHVLDAARTEFIKLGLPRIESDFVPPMHVLEGM